MKVGWIRIGFDPRQHVGDATVQRYHCIWRCGIRIGGRGAKIHCSPVTKVGWIHIGLDSEAASNWHSQRHIGHAMVLLLKEDVQISGRSQKVTGKVVSGTHSAVLLISCTETPKI